MKKHYKSDFTLAVTTLSASDEAIVKLCSQCDFSGAVTSGAQCRAFKFSRSGDTFHNCALRQGQLLIICNDHGLQPGRVVVTLTVQVPNALYPDGLESLTAVIHTDLHLTPDGDTEVGEVEVNAVLPYVSPYAVAVRGGYQGTEEEYDAMLSALPSRLADFSVLGQRLTKEMEQATAEATSATAEAKSAASSATSAAEQATTAASSAQSATQSATEATQTATDAATAATEAATETSAYLSEAEEQMYYQMWLAVRGRAAAIVKVRAGGKVTANFRGEDPATSEHTIVKYGDPDRDSFVLIEDKGVTKINVSGNSWGILGQGSRDANKYGTNATDVLELAAFDINPEHITNIWSKFGVPAPHLYTREWVIKNIRLTATLTYLKLQGVLDTRNWGMTGQTYICSWNWEGGTFGSTISKLILTKEFFVGRTDMGGLFRDLSLSTSDDILIQDGTLHDIDTSAVTSMSNTFYGSAFTSLDLSGWDTHNLQSMFQTFRGCNKLLELNMAGWYTGALTDTQWFMRECGALRKITLSEGFFATTALLPFGDYCRNLGLSTDGTSNGTLEHILEKMPTIRTKEGYTELLEQEDGVWYLNDGQARTIQFHSNVKNKAWAQPIIAQMQAKGYTIA